MDHWFFAKERAEISKILQNNCRKMTEYWNLSVFSDNTIILIVWKWVRSQFNTAKDSLAVKLSDHSFWIRENLLRVPQFLSLINNISIFLVCCWNLLTKVHFQSLLWDWCLLSPLVTDSVFLPSAAVKQRHKLQHRRLTGTAADEELYTQSNLLCSKRQPSAYISDSCEMTQEHIHSVAQSSLINSHEADWTESTNPPPCQQKWQWRWAVSSEETCSPASQRQTRHPAHAAAQGLSCRTPWTHCTLHLTGQWTPQRMTNREVR